MLYRTVAGQFETWLALSSASRFDGQGDHRTPAHYLWAVLIARIYEVFPLVCPLCGGNMRLIAFLTEGVQIRKILEHIGVDAQAQRIAPARGPPLWDDCDAQGAAGVGEGVRVEPDWGESAQMALDEEADQRTDW